MILAQSNLQFLRYGEKLGAISMFCTLLTNPHENSGFLLLNVIRFADL